MRRWIAIVLFGILVLPSVSTWVFLTTKRLEWKAAVYQKLVQTLPQEMITTIRVIAGDPDLHWVEDREFRYEGQWYDVIRTTQKGDTIWYECLADATEKAFEEQLESLMSSGDQPDGQRPLTSRLLDLLNQQWCEPGIDIIHSPSLYWTENRPDFIRKCLGQEARSPEVPPPNKMC